MHTFYVSMPCLKASHGRWGSHDAIQHEQGVQGKQGWGAAEGKPGGAGSGKVSGEDGGCAALDGQDRLAP